MPDVHDDLIIHLLESRVAFLESRLAHLETRLGLPLGMPTPPTLPGMPPTTPDPDPSWYPVRHKACGETAFYLTRAFSPEERGQITAMRIQGVDPGWREPASGEPSRCSHCGYPVDPFTDKDLDWSGAVSPPNPGMPPVAPSPADPTGRLSVLGDLFALAKEAGLDLSTMPPPPPPPRS